VRAVHARIEYGDHGAAAVVSGRPRLVGFDERRAVGEHGEEEHVVQDAGDVWVERERSAFLGSLASLWGGWSAFAASPLRRDNLRLCIREAKVERETGIEPATSSLGSEISSQKSVETGRMTRNLACSWFWILCAVGWGLTGSESDNHGHSKKDRVPS
jgi:hypothetical protein